MTGEQNGAPTTPLAEFIGVTKWYGAVIGINEVSVRLEPGLTGLLGPNGAGKTTLIKLLTGQLRPSLGEVRVCGQPAWSAAAKRHIGYSPDSDALYEEMSGREFVRTMARLGGMDRRTALDRTEAALVEVGMADRGDRTLRGCSKGMRQRIRLAQALVHEPDLLVVDEPLNGVDPVGRRELMDLFRRYRDRGKTVLISSHILDEIDELAERVIFLGRGRLLAVGSLTEIRQMLATFPLRVRIKATPARDVSVELVRLEQVRTLELTDQDVLDLEVRQPEAFFAAFSQLVAAHSEWKIHSVESTDESAEAVFNYVLAASARF